MAKSGRRGYVVIMPSGFIHAFVDRFPDHRPVLQEKEKVEEEEEKQEKVRGPGDATN